jgi:hypothetical protein
VLFQAQHTAAPWAERPSPLTLLIIPGGLFGHIATPLLAIAVFFAVRRRPPIDRAVRMLLGLAIGTALLAWLSSQIEPAWATRYSAVLMGPLLLALASVVARGRRWTVLALVGVAAVWALSGPPATKSNVRIVSTSIAPSIRPGDLVVSTQPETVPALHRYLPDGAVYLTPLGLVADPRQTDWRDGLARLRGGQAETELLPVVARLDPGTRVLIVTPVPGERLSQSPWARAVRIRTREWHAALEDNARLRPIGGVTTLPSGKNVVRARLYEVR